MLQSVYYFRGFLSGLQRNEHGVDLGEGLAVEIIAVALRSTGAGTIVSWPHQIDFVSLTLFAPFTSVKKLTSLVPRETKVGRAQTLGVR
jgi:hypothetical protein